MNKRNKIVVIQNLFIWVLLFGLFVSCGLLDGEKIEPRPTVELQRDEAPSWSPDGRFIAYNHYDPAPKENESHYSLRLINLSTSEDRLIVDGFALNPDWSPDGQWIAFNSGDLYKVHPDGTELLQITNLAVCFSLPLVTEFHSVMLTWSSAPIIECHKVFCKEHSFNEV